MKNATIGDLDKPTVFAIPPPIPRMSNVGVTNEKASCNHSPVVRLSRFSIASTVFSAL